MKLHPKIITFLSSLPRLTLSVLSIAVPGVLIFLATINLEPVQRSLFCFMLLSSLTTIGSVAFGAWLWHRKERRESPMPEMPDLEAMMSKFNGTRMPMQPTEDDLPFDDRGRQR